MPSSRPLVRTSRPRNTQQGMHLLYACFPKHGINRERWEAVQSASEDHKYQVTGVVGSTRLVLLVTGLHRDRPKEEMPPHQWTVRPSGRVWLLETVMRIRSPATMLTAGPGSMPFTVHEEAGMQARIGIFLYPVHVVVLLGKHDSLEMLEDASLHSIDLTQCL